MGKKMDTSQNELTEAILGPYSNQVRNNRRMGNRRMANRNNSGKNNNLGLKDYQIQKTQNSETSENNSENQENVDPYHNLSINDQSVLHLNNKLAQRLRRDTPSSATTNSISNSNNSSPLAARNAEFYNENRHESPDKRSKLDDSYCDPLSNHSLNNISTFKPEPGFSSTKAEIHLN